MMPKPRQQPNKHSHATDDSNARTLHGAAEQATRMQGPPRSIRCGVGRIRTQKNPKMCRSIPGTVAGGGRPGRGPPPAERYLQGRRYPVPPFQATGRCCPARAWYARSPGRGRGALRDLSQTPTLRVWAPALRVRGPTLRVKAPTLRVITLRVGARTLRVGAHTLRVGVFTLRVGPLTLRVGARTLRVGGPYS